MANFMQDASYKLHLQFSNTSGLQGPSLNLFSQDQCETPPSKPAFGILFKSQGHIKIGH